MLGNTAKIGFLLFGSYAIIFTYCEIQPLADRLLRIDLQSETNEKNLVMFAVFVHKQVYFPQVVDYHFYRKLLKMKKTVGRQLLYLLRELDDVWLGTV